MGSRLDANSTAVRKRIEKHKFEDEEGEEYEPSKFGGFTDYFRRKKIKLQNLDVELRSATSNPPIFRGVVAHVNGYTQPSLNDLHGLIVAYGGGFMQYLDGKTTVTHIIASNLTPKKKIEFRRYRIVKPAWVVDSVKAGRLLPWDAYRVVDEGSGQQTLGFENGSVISQASSQYAGYRDQTDTSWYTGQIKSVADSLNRGDLNPDELDISFPSVQLSSDDKEDFSTAPPNQQAQKTESNRVHSPMGGHGVQLPSGEEEIEHGDRSTSATGEDEHENGTTLEAMPPFLDAPQSAIDVKLGHDQNFGDLARYNDDQQAQLVDKRAQKTAEDHNAALLADPRVWKSTVVNPGFLKQYYEESRLHHLSAWKADLKSKLQALAAEKSSSQISKQKRPPGSRRYILHVDFDSFFAAVSLLKYPQYVDKPAVVAHGGGSGSEIASCNYPARKFGVKNGMWMKTAQGLCQDLKVLPYDFQAYEEASKNFYEAIISTGGLVQSVSVDEALVDISVTCIQAGGYEGKGIQEGSVWREQAKADKIAQSLRSQIKERTGCAVSVGIGGNILLAKVALRKAKPAGQYQIKPEDVLDFIGALTVQDLPGVAYSIGGKLEEIGVRFVKDIRELTKEKLMTTLGPKTGEKIWDYSLGIDRTEVGEQVVRKSVSAEVNWGIRFVTQEQADEFVESLCEELSKRLVNEKVKGRQLTMKIMRRAADAPLDPPKHLGHGKCDTYNKSVVLGVSTNAKDILSREAISIMRGWGFSPGELRGIGVQVTRLEPLKGTLESPVASSQKRLQFKTNTPKTMPRVMPLPPKDSIDKTESPQKPRRLPSQLVADKPVKVTEDAHNRPLNTLGTQFLMPTQIDPEVLAELPADIQSKLLRKESTGEETDNTTSVRSAASGSPQPQAQAQARSYSPDILPAQSQLDLETLNALPSDVRAEILSFYQKSSRQPHAQAILPQSPRKIRSLKPSKKPITPIKKRPGLLFRGKHASKLDANSTLTQSNFVANRVLPKTNGDNTANPSDTDEVSPDFLSALPEDIRREILAQQRRDRLKKRGGIDLATKKKANKPQPDHPPGQRRLQLPPRPPKPTFTAKKLNALPELREMICAWFEEFRDEGPYSEDLEALGRYLKKVVCEELDLAKAVAVVKWLAWVVDEGDGNGVEEWEGEVVRVREEVQEAVSARGLGSVVF